MNNSVIIKGTKSGIIVVLDDSLDFETLRTLVAEKFRASSDFLGEATMAIRFEGRELTNEEQREILDIINQNSKLNVVCVVETNPQTEELFQKSLQERLLEMNSNTGQFYKGNLRSGQVLESETSIIVIGDVKPGAKVVSKGNIIVLGSLRGNAFAGASGNESAFVLALDMFPVQIRIADIIARAPDEPQKNRQKETKVAYIEDGNIYIEPFTKDVINDIHFI